MGFAINIKAYFELPDFDSLKLYNPCDRLNVCKMQNPVG